MSHYEKMPSFSKAMFSGQIEEDLLFPYPKMKPEEEENVNILIDSLKKFAKEKIDDAKIDKEGKIPKEVIDGLKELGLFGIMIPEEYGGFGLSQTAYAKIFEAVAGNCGASISALLGAHQSIGLKGIILFGTDEQKKKYLPDLASGEKIAAFALTEPGSGSDAASIKTTAVLSPDGKYYILNGSKLWITNGGIAETFTVFAKTEVEEQGEKKQKISAFIVEREMGVKSGKEEEKLGIKGSSTTELYFEDVKVPVENLLGEKGKGFKIAMEILNSGRLGLGAGCVGGSKAILAKSVEHAKQRKQFGKPIAEFEMIQDKIARMAVETYALESTIYATTGMVDKDGIDYSIESAICKVFGSETLWRTVNECLQIAAGIGYMKEYPYERYLRDSRINIIFEGTNEILRVFIALAGMQPEGEYLKQIGKAMRDPIKSFGFLADFAVHELKERITTPTLTKVHPALSHEAMRFQDYVKDFHLAVEKTLVSYGKDIIEKEFIQKRIADMAIDLFCMIATISRTTSLIQEKGEEKVKTEISLCRAFVSDAWRRLKRNLDYMDSNNDEYLKKIASVVYEHNGYRF
jgi:acyl-CoA dehydrogenase family protein 9